MLTDDVACFLRCRVFDREERAQQVHLQHAHELFDRTIQERGHVAEDARVGEEHVDATVRFTRAFDQRLHDGFIGRVACNCDCRCVELGHEFLRGLQAFGVDVRDDEPRACLRKQQRRRATNATTRTGDDHRLVF